jgi:hypothetical protein
MHALATRDPSQNRPMMTQMNIRWYNIGSRLNGLRRAHAAATWETRLPSCLGALKGLLCGVFCFGGPESMSSWNALPRGWTQEDPFFLFPPPRMLPRGRPDPANLLTRSLHPERPTDPRSPGRSHTAGARKANQTCRLATLALDSAVGTVI